MVGIVLPKLSSNVIIVLPLHVEGQFQRRTEEVQNHSQVIECLVYFFRTTVNVYTLKHSPA